MRKCKYLRKSILLLTMLFIIGGGVFYLGTSAPAAESFPNPHGGYTSGTAVCAKCHSGHTSFTYDLLNSLSQRQTCYNCHDGSNSNYNVREEFGEVTVGASVYSSYHPVPNEAQMCTNCHDPHLNPAATPRLLAVGGANVASGNAVCGVCHGATGNIPPDPRGKQPSEPAVLNDMVTPFTGTAHDTGMPAPASGTGIKCVGCHAPHGSPNKPLLKQQITGPEGVTSAVTGDDNTLCFACHTSSSASYAGSAIYQQIKHGNAISTSYSETSRKDFALGTLTGVSATSLGELNLALDTGLLFNGSADKIDCSTSYSSTVQNTFTYEFWAKPGATHEIDTQTSAGTAGTSGQKYAIGAENGGSSLAGVGVSVGTNGVSVYEHASGYMPPLLVYTGALNNWTHIAVVYTNKNPKLYINGALVSTGLTGSNTPFPSRTFGYGPYGYYSGSLKDIRIWNYARTPAQITADMNRQLTGSEAGLIGYWRLDEGSGNTAYDWAGTNHGTITGAAGSHFAASGNRVSPEFNLPSAAYIGSQIQWTAATPASTALTVETNLYMNGSWQGWQPVTNGGAVPGLAAGTDMTGGKLQYRVNMSTSDQSVTPSLQDIAIRVTHEATVAVPTYPGTGYEGSLCLNCHEPHGQTGNANYLRAEGNDLCTNCHDDASITHPANYSYQGSAAYTAGAHNTAAPTPVLYQYPLSDSESLAWEKSGDSTQFPTPSSPGVAATVNQKSAVYATDGIFWATGSAAAEGDYNYQMFKFHVNEDLANIRTLTGKWRGYGEPTAGHLTELFIWNKSSLNWESLDSGLLGDPDNPGLLSGSLSSGFSDYLDNNNDVYLMARAEHDATPPVISGISVTNGGTSAIFNWTTDETTNSYVYFDIYSRTTLEGYANWWSDSSYVTTHALPVAGLNSDTDYYYRILTIDQLGNETISAEQTLHTSLAPTTPTNLSGPTTDPAAGNFVTVNFSWNASHDLDPTDTVSYQVQVFKDGVQLGSTINTAANGISYYLDYYNGPHTVSWRVRAVDSHGIASAWANGPSFPHQGIVDSCMPASLDGKSLKAASLDSKSLKAASLDRVNTWVRQAVLAVAGLNILKPDEKLAYTPSSRRHFSVNTDYVELDVDAVDPGVLSGYCGTCHAPHGKDDGTGNPIPKQLDYALPAACFGGGFGCHGDAGNSVRGVNISAKVSSSNALARHGASSGGQAANGTLDCANCHNPHTNTAEAKVIDPFNKGNTYALTNQMTNYVGPGGEVYVMAKARHDGRPPAVSSGPTVSNLQANQATVSWSTDETTVGYVYYGPVGSGYTAKATSVNGQNTAHTAYLTGLVLGTNYKFSLWAQDSVGNYRTTADQVVDSVPPVIMGAGPSVALDNYKATFNWTTNEASTSYVDYTPDEIYSVGDYAYNAGSETLTTSHSVSVDGLVAGAVYHYRVYSYDARGNRVTSADNQFKMSNSPPAPTGVGPTGALLDGTTPLPITIQWNPVADPDGDTVQYFAQLSTDINFATSSSSGWTSGTTWSTQVDNWDDLTYYWRVMAKDEWGAASVWSSVYSFMHRGPASSCPNLYVWDGKKYQFVTDIAGSVVGKKNTSTGKFTPIYPGLPVAIPWNMLQEKDGQYSIKIKSERDEVDFIDRAVLTAVDHPEGTRIAFNALTRAQEPIKMYTYSADLRPLKRATYFDNSIYTGVKGLKLKDITELVAKPDNQEAEGVYGDDNQFTFDLGDLNGAKQIKLVLQGWTDFSTRTEKSAALEKYSQGVKRARTFYEILQPDGTWKEYGISHFNGLPKTEVLDLTGQFPEGTKDYVVRLRGMHRPRIDYVGIDISAPAEFKEQDLEVIKADLGYRGISKPTEDGKSFEYDSISRLKLTHEGNFTRYGDVWPLLREVDDKPVVMDSGDEITLNFRALPPPAPGMTRSFFLKNWVYYKEFELAKVEPVPFRGMDISKLPNSFGKYPDELKSSLATWNTRVHEAGMSYDKGFWGKLQDKFLAFMARMAKSFALLWNSLWNSLFAGDTGTKDNPTSLKYKPAIPKWWEERPWEDHYSLNTNFISLQVDDTVYSSTAASVLTINSPGSAIWEGSTEPSPSTPGTDASAHAAEISGRDGINWRTDNYPAPNSSDGSYNYQMFKFTIAQPLSQLFSFKVFWEGYGEPSTGYNTTVSLWNFNTNTWDSIKSQVMGNNTAAAAEKAVNYNTYCYNCHGGSVPTGVDLGSMTRNIASSFTGDIHGGGTGPQWIAGDGGGEWAPNYYTTAGSIAPSYARGDATGLQCADCHDIHGSQNVYHLRETLNASDGVKSNPANAVNSVPGADYANNANVQNFCASCHTGTLDDYHRACLDCHRTGAYHSSPPTDSDFGRSCVSCHTHGGTMPRHGRCHCWLDSPAKAF